MWHYTTVFQTLRFRLPYSNENTLIEDFYKICSLTELKSSFKTYKVFLYDTETWNSWQLRKIEHNFTVFYKILLKKFFV